MRNQELLEQIQRRIAEVIAQTPARDLEANLRAMATSFFSRLDLVTREEFDVQRAVLLRTREKLEQLEARLAQLEAQAAATPDASDAPRP
jgi:ubiquinone biosynthesis accessory factor UbiK